MAEEFKIPEGSTDLVRRALGRMYYTEVAVEKLAAAEEEQPKDEDIRKEE